MNLTFQKIRLSKITRVAFLALTMFLSGCLYTNVKVPLDTDVDATVLGEKVGKASNQSVLWLVAWGDASTQAAAKEGNISTIRHMDIQQLIVFFGLYAEATTIVYGD